MNSIQGRLGLTIPTQTQSTSADFGDFKKENIEEWAQGLPQNNLGIMNKALYEFIVELNKTTLSPQVRFEALELILPQVVFVTQSLNTRYMDDNDVPKDKRKKIALLIEILNMEMCLGYKLIIETLGTRLFKKKSVLLKALHRVSIFLLEILQKCYQMYTSAPRNLWRELHIIYQYAERNRLLNKNVDHFDSRSIRHSTVQSAYKHALLLACANPYRLRNQEIFKLNFALEAWAPMLVLNKYTPHNKEIFLVDLKDDSPPHYTDLKLPASKSSLSLNFDKINQRIDEILNHAHKRDPGLTFAGLPCEFQISITVLKFLKASWSSFTDRGTNRIDQKGQVRVTLGLKTTYAAIIHYTRVDNTIGESVEDQESEIIYMDALPLPVSTDEKPSFKLIPAEYVNISPTGFCFEWKEPIAADLKTGEIIGIEQNPELEGILCIGIVRWIKQMDDETVRCGVKLISPYAIPILTIIPDQAHKLGIKSLLLPSEPRYHPMVTIIAPALPFREGATVTISHQGKNYSIHLKSVVDNSSTFNQFNITFEDNTDIPFVHSHHPFRIDNLWNKMNL